MSKKPTTKTVIENLNLEIDYDKLAEAIVRASEAASDPKKKGSKHRRILLRIANVLAYLLIAISTVVCLIIVWSSLYQTHWKLLPCIIVSIVLGGFLVLMLLCFNESYDDDYQDALTLFTTNISIVALIVAIIALIKAN